MSLSELADVIVAIVSECGTRSVSESDRRYAKKIAEGLQERGLIKSVKAAESRPEKSEKGKGFLRRGTAKSE